MVSVDDLVISLRIDDTSNLGKLQKQLTALVGPKGEKVVELGGLGGVAKTDLNWIKSKLMEISPAVLPTEVKALKESAKISLRQLMKKELQEILIAKYGVPKSEIETWMINLAKAITEKDINTGKLANFIERISDMIKGSARIGGMEKSRVTAVRKALTERFIESEFIGLMERAGIFVRSQYQHYEIDPEKAVNLREKIDKEIGNKIKEIKELYGKEYTKDLADKIVELSQDTRDSEEFVSKALNEVMKLSSDNVEKLMEKLKMGIKDPLLTVLGLLRIKSAEDKKGMTIIENLKHAVANVLKQTFAETYKATDIKMLKTDIQKLIDEGSKHGIKVSGDLDALNKEGEQVIIELKKVFTKTTADAEIQDDRRAKEIGKKLIIYLSTGSTRGGRRARTRWQEASRAEGLGIDYIWLEGNFRDIEKTFDVQQDLGKMMGEAGVFKEYDKDVDALQDVKDNISNLIEGVKEKGEFKDVRDIIGKIYDHILDVKEGQDYIKDAVVKERHDIDWNREPTEL